MKLTGVGAHFWPDGRSGSAVAFGFGASARAALLEYTDDFEVILAKLLCFMQKWISVSNQTGDDRGYMNASLGTGAMHQIVAMQEFIQNQRASCRDSLRCAKNNNNAFQSSVSGPNACPMI
jgi:hypothetical protein